MKYGAFSQMSVVYKQLTMRVLLSALQTRRKTPIRCLEFPLVIRQRMKIEDHSYLIHLLRNHQTPLFKQIPNLLRQICRLYQLVRFIVRV